MSFYSAWRDSRDRRRRASAYVERLALGRGPSDAAWLARAANEEFHATREVMFMHRAMALIVAERDALDDRTASDVSRALASIVDHEMQRNPDTGALWTVRWREYSSALAMRGSIESPSTRFARVLLGGAGLRSADDALLASAVQAVQSTRNAANEALRAAFGVATLPDDVRPSAIQG